MQHLSVDDYLSLSRLVVICEESCLIVIQYTTLLHMRLNMNDLKANVAEQV